MCRVSWYTAGTRNPGTTGPTSQIKFSWTDGDQGEVTGAQFWFSDDVRRQEGNRIVYFTDGRVMFIYRAVKYRHFINDSLSISEASSARCTFAQL